jgi:hypothetical protein
LHYNHNTRNNIVKSKVIDGLVYGV